MKRIAIVDDEPDITFNDPQVALESFRPGNYDLMIIDIRMPKKNGFDLYRELKKKDDNVKVCFLTAFEIYYEEFRKMFTTMGVQAFIRKPISISSLVRQMADRWPQLSSQSSS